MCIPDSLGITFHIEVFAILRESRYIPLSRGDTPVAYAFPPSAVLRYGHKRRTRSIASIPTRDDLTVAHLENLPFLSGES
jgi:hypothetical protein